MPAPTHSPAAVPRPSAASGDTSPPAGVRAPLPPVPLPRIWADTPVRKNVRPDRRQVCRCSARGGNNRCAAPVNADSGGLSPPPRVRPAIPGHPGVAGGYCRRRSGRMPDKPCAMADRWRMRPARRANGFRWRAAAGNRRAREYRRHGQSSSVANGPGTCWNGPAAAGRERNRARRPLPWARLRRSTRRARGPRYRQHRPASRKGRPAAPAPADRASAAHRLAVRPAWAPAWRQGFADCVR